MKKNIYGDCYLKKTYVINELNGEMFKLGKWEKDVICGLMESLTLGLPPLVLAVIVGLIVR